MISVCMATYNGERYILRQLETILPQLAENDEIIISDDASTDQTLELIEQLHSPLIHIYKNQGTHGYTPNFENALKHAKGDYIFLSDQDDEWHPNKVEVCLNSLKKYDFVVSDAVIIDSFGVETEPSFYAQRHPRRTFWGNMIKFGYLGCCFAFRRRILQKAMPFPTNHTLCTHDNWLFLSAKFFYKVDILDEPLVNYRRHEQNASTGDKTGHRSLFFRVHYRLYLILHLLYRRCRG